MVMVSLTSLPQQVVLLQRVATTKSTRLLPLGRLQYPQMLLLITSSWQVVVVPLTVNLVAVVLAVITMLLVTHLLAGLEVLSLVAAGAVMAPEQVLVVVETHPYRV
jgi:hypothetical protein